MNQSWVQGSLALGLAFILFNLTHTLEVEEVTVIPDPADSLDHGNCEGLSSDSGCTAKDLGSEFTTLDDELVDVDVGNEGNSSEPRAQRRRRSTPPPEDNYDGLNDRTQLSDMYDKNKEHFNTAPFGQQAARAFVAAIPAVPASPGMPGTPAVPAVSARGPIATIEGYATSDRTVLLQFDVSDIHIHYPVFTYRGFYNKKKWHEISIDRFMKKRNRSFMLLNHDCEELLSRIEEKECAKKKYPTLPKCDQFDQSPIDINTTKARDSSLKEFIFEYLYENDDRTKNAIEFDFILSVPWDGTDLLTVELDTLDLNPNPTAPLSTLPHPPRVSKGSIVGVDLHLERIHIKYGKNMENGSEHTLNRNQYGMELQFIFSKHGRNKKEQYWDVLFKYYSSISGTQERRKNVHLFAIMVEVVSNTEFEKTNLKDKSGWNRRASAAFKVISDAARMFWRINNVKVDYPASAPEYHEQTFKYRAFKNKPSAKLKLGEILPPRLSPEAEYVFDDSIYYHYKGSITHPPCFGYVDWAVFDKPLKISADMWQNFLYIPSEFDDTKFIAGNFRKPEDIYVKGGPMDKKSTVKQRNATQTKINARDLRKSKRSKRAGDKENYYYEDDADWACPLRENPVVSVMLPILIWIITHKITEL